MGSRAGLITSHKVALLTLIGIYVERDTPRDLSLFLINAIKVRKPFSPFAPVFIFARAFFTRPTRRPRRLPRRLPRQPSHFLPHCLFTATSSLFTHSLLSSLRRLLHSSLRRLLAPLTSLASPRFSPLASLVSPRFAPLASLHSLHSLHSTRFARVARSCRSLHSLRSCRFA